MFSSLTNKLSSVFDKLSLKKHITENDIDNATREIRVSLLEADVNLSVIKQLVDKIRSSVMGEKILKGVNPVQQIIKTVNDEIVKILGEKNVQLNIDPNKLNIFLRYDTITTLYSHKN